MFKTEHPARHYFVSSRIAMRSPLRADFETLLHPVLRGMRQRTFVILNPYVIPRIDPAVARLAPEKMFDFPNPTPVDALAEQRPARSRFIE